MAARERPARLFVATELPHATRAELSAWGVRAAAGDAALRALPAASLHLTLHFLGGRPESEIPALAAVVRRAAAVRAPLALRLAGTLWLSPRRPHVLACAVADPGAALAGLHEALAGPLAEAAAGWQADGRPFTPHVTVARVRRGARARVGQEPPGPQGGLAVPALALLRSHPQTDGPRYEILQRAALPL